MAVQEVSVDVPNAVTVKLDQPRSPSPIVGPFLLLVAGFIGWAAATFLDYEDNVMAKANYQLSLSNDLKSIVVYIKEGEYCLATALLDDNQVAAKMVGAPPSSAVVVLSKQVANPDKNAAGTFCQSESEAPQPEALSKEQVQADLFSPQRRQFAEQYVTTYNSGNEQTKKSIVAALIDAIVGPEDGVRRYRINIYIALTFSLLPQAELTAGQQERLKALKDTAEYKQDRQFKINVDRAIEQQFG